MRPLMPWRVAAILLTVAGVFLVIDAVLVFRLLHANGRDAVGVVVAVLMGVALLASYFAGVAAGRAFQARRGGAIDPAVGVRRRAMLPRGCGG
jgi:hypothetical protein